MVQKRSGSVRSIVIAGAFACAASAVASAPGATQPMNPTLASVIPGKSTKTSVEAALGQPWRVVQFDDCGMPMPGQADETWEYRGKDSSGAYRLHIEFNDAGAVTIAAKMSDATGNGPVEAAPSNPSASDMSKMGM
jgi:hypothetical protein